LGGYIFGNCAGRGALWFYRDRHGGSGNAKFLFFLFLAVCLILFIVGLSVAKRL